MPRNSAGVYTLPASNPVVPFTTIATAWANPTMSDIGAELTNSLDRTGRGGMLAPFRIFDGTVTQPGLAFANEAGLGLWRSSAGTMNVTSLGANVMTWEPGQATSPVKMILFGTTQFRLTGQHWWEAKVATDDTLTLSPSATINAEDFAAAKAVKITAAGILNAPVGIISAGGIIAGNWSQPVAGEARASAFVTTTGGYVGLNVDFVSGGWAFVGASGFGYLKQLDATGLTEYISGAASAGVATAAGLVSTAKYTPTSVGFGLPVNIQSPVGRRNPASGEVFNLDIVGVNQAKQVTYAYSAGVGFKVTVNSSGHAFDTMRMTDTGDPWVGQGGLPFIWRHQKGNGLLEQMMKFDPSGLISFGDSSTTVPGAVVSTYKNFGAGAYTGTLTFSSYQMAIVAPGSNITGLTMTFGQIARILVNGAGAITLPAFIKLAVGSTGNWGSTASIVSMVYSDATVFGTITPF
jgi:hypothetical protein